MTAEISHTQILKQPNARVSRLLTLLKLDNIGSSARNKADLVREGLDEDDKLLALYAQWFEDLADMTNRAINELNDSSEEIKYWWAST